MIAFSIARAKRILLISFAPPGTRETCYGSTPSARRRRDGAMDMIVAPGEFEALGV
jgi:hypothetical protein